MVAGLWLVASSGGRLEAQPIYIATQNGDSVPIPHPDDSAHLWVKIQDSTYVYLRQGGSSFVIPAYDVAAAYTFEMLYDSTFLISYDFSECRYNRQRWRLRNWKNKRVVNANARLLSFNSGTDPLTLRAGDTLSFYRELTWHNLATGEQDTANYYALDSLDYTVELVRLSDSTRVATLDTIGILANQTPGPPRIHGTHPLMATVPYVVPASLDGVRAFLRVLVFHRGPGLHWFSRRDHVTMGLSRWMNDPNWQDFLNVFNPLAPKTAIDELAAGETGAAPVPMLDVTAEPGQLIMTFDCSPTAGRTLVSVFDAAGRQLYSPYVTTGVAGSARAGYRYPSSGPYFVALYHDGRLARVRKIIVR